MECVANARWVALLWLKWSQEHSRLWGGSGSPVRRRPARAGGMASEHCSSRVSDTLNCVPYSGVHGERASRGELVGDRFCPGCGARGWIPVLLTQSGPEREDGPSEQSPSVCGVRRSGSRMVDNTQGEPNMDFVRYYCVSPVPTQETVRSSLSLLLRGLTV